jgi:hypothetical protein
MLPELGSSGAPVNAVMGRFRVKAALSSLEGVIGKGA